MTDSNVQTTAGTTIGISATLPATENKAGYEALTFALIGEVTDLGEYGKEYSTVTHNPIASRKTIKRKGSYNNGTLALQLGIDAADAGQVICDAAVDSDNNYAFKVTYQDGTVDYFSGQIMSFKTNAGSVDQILSGAINIELNTDVISVALP
ncbi:MAG TPA: phage tail tube protein [Acinetobacter sp.]|nr:phage tail tube protein [Acinetobacter sp.]